MKRKTGNVLAVRETAADRVPQTGGAFGLARNFQGEKTMKRFARLLLVTVGFGALGFVMSLVPQRNATGAGAAPVTIASPLPVPVTGSVNAAVTGTVAAQQSGSWNVGITGTPTVNANVTFPSSIGVQNAKDLSSLPIPLLQQDTDNPARQPFTLECTISTFDTSGKGFCLLDPIPTGKRFVIEAVSGGVTTTPGIKPIQLNLQVNTAGTFRDYFFSATFQGTSSFFGDSFVVYQPVRIYADGGSTSVFNVTMSNTISTLFELVVSGYLISVS